MIRLKTYEDSSESGKLLRRKFCPTCGSPILSEAGSYGLNDNPGTSENKCRCVRVGQQESGQGSGNGSLIESSLGINAAQSITMIGPMYRYDECDENCFLWFNIHYIIIQF